MLNWRPGTDRKLLQQRADLLCLIRGFFSDRQVLEVETPALSRAATTDPVIQSIPARVADKEFFLHSSPEFAMKRLLASGSRDIFQICKVFRAGESGRFHNPEFTLLEWYRLEMDYLTLANEVVTLIQLVNGRKEKLHIETISYSELFKLYIDVEIGSIDIQVLKKTAEERIPGCPPNLTFNGYLDLLLSHCICPQLDSQQLTIVYDYPASQAALARLNTDGVTAARFEVFWGGLELANGFQELRDAEEQRQRFMTDNKWRRKQRLAEMPIDENLLAALDAGLPECSGVALGLDRLLMCVTGAAHINEVLTFNIENC